MAEIKVKHLPRDPGPAGWNRLLPEPAPAQPLQGAQVADWLVIGAGFAGLAAARRLAQNAPGDRIIVLEASRLGDGPAGRNSGFMIDLPHDLTSDDYGGALDDDITQTSDNRSAIAFAADMAREYGLSAEAFHPSGKINAAATAKGDAHNKSYARHLSAMGEPHEMLDAAQMRALTGTDYYQAGLFTPGAAMIQPAQFIRGIAAGMTSNRLTIHENSPVTALDQNGDWVATTPAGRVTAARVILAVNGHLNSFGFAAGRLMHVFTYASMTRALAPEEIARLGGAPIWGATPSDPMGTTVRRISGTGGDRIIIRNRFTLNQGLEAGPKLLERVAMDHDRAFTARFGMLKSVDMEYRWGGRLCLSLNGVQVVAEMAPGLYAACCQNGLGTVKGTLAGLCAADLATGRQTKALTRMMAQEAPKRLPPPPFLPLGATARLKWGEWRAGREL
ncbi:MAG: FAD-binding oxidoreductase [Pseudomonadota bacterium]